MFRRWRKLLLLYVFSYWGSLSVINTKGGAAMAKKKGKPSTDEIQIDLLKNILITQLGLAGVSQQNIRKIVGCDIGRVTAVMRHLKKSD
jgi:hypothetical protein